jgi:glycerol-3-phosphate O-acyltransferase
MSLVLEAETLISDSLQREGRGQYIIVDDEFSHTRTIFGFAKRMMAFDDPVHVVFGEPLDLMGNPVDAEGRSLDPQGRPIDRRAYVTDRDGQLIIDPQRDRIYTERLASKLVTAWHRDTIPLPTQIAAFAAWAVIAQRFPALDSFRLVRLEEPYRRLTRSQLLQSISRTLDGLARAAAAGRVRQATHTNPEEVAKIALRHFSRFHSVPALADGLDGIEVSMELTLYYRNRLVGFELDERAIGAAE